MKWYELRSEEVEKKVNTSLSHGLSDQEVKQRQKQFGYNELKEAERPSAILLFLAQFKDFMVLVLLAATLISGLLGEYIDAIAIMAIVLINGFLGFFQERKAEKSLQALKELSAPQVNVFRSNEWGRVLSKELVIGDIIKFTSGDRIGADVRLIDVKSLEIEESALTGESVPVTKHVEPIRDGDVSLGDQENMAFMGTMVTRGSGVGIVVGTGMNTAMGQIAELLQSAEAMITPLQRRLEQLGKVLITVALILTLLVVVVGVINGHELYEMFLAGVSLAVAAIPEGLPAIVTVALSLGVQRMIKKNAIVRRLPAVETLGCASVICSDKTGTMTQNKMTVTHLWSGGKTWSVSGTGYDVDGKFFSGDREIKPSEHKTLQQLLTFGVLCNNASLKQKDDDIILDGDPTEGALLVAGIKAGLTNQLLAEQFDIVEEFPFDSARKMMSVIVKDRAGNQFVVTKGAPDVLLGVSKSVLWDNKQQPLTAGYENEIKDAIEGLASDALRTIAVGFKQLRPNQKLVSEREAESELTFIGIQGMIDPPRPEVKDAVKECKDAGIKTVMITGDHLITAKAIATQLGILPHGGKF